MAPRDITMDWSGHNVASPNGQSRPLPSTGGRSKPLLVIGAIIVGLVIVSAVRSRHYGGDARVPSSSAPAAESSPARYEPGDRATFPASALGVDPLVLVQFIVAKGTDVLDKKSDVMEWCAYIRSHKGNVLANRECLIAVSRAKG